MSWLGANSFFLIILLLCIGMHLFHRHGDHSGDSDDNEEGPPHDRHNH